MSDLDHEFKYKIKTVIAVDYTSIEQLIDKYFKNENHNEGYSITDNEDKDNDEYWEISVEPVDFYIYHRDALDRIKKGEWPSYFTRSMLNHLCFKGVIPSGDYLISICW